MTAHDILQAAAGHMKDRAATYDKPEGERSMGATVEAFKAVTGHQMTEEQGWLFMAILKAVRSQQGAYRKDSYEDGAAYFALAGEAAERDRKKPVIHELYGVTSQEGAAAMAAAWEEGEKRMEQIGPNGNDGLAYEKEWTANSGDRPDLPEGTVVEVRIKDGRAFAGVVDSWLWGLEREFDEITHYRLA